MRKYFALLHPSCERQLKKLSSWSALRPIGHFLWAALTLEFAGPLLVSMLVLAEAAQCSWSQWWRPLSDHIVCIAGSTSKSCHSHSARFSSGTSWVRYISSVRTGTTANHWLLFFNYGDSLCQSLRQPENRGSRVLKCVGFSQQTWEREGRQEQMLSENWPMSSFFKNLWFNLALNSVFEWQR